MNVFILGVARQGRKELLACSYMEKELKLLGILPTVIPVADEAQLKAAVQRIVLMGGLILTPLTGNANIDKLLSDQMAKACGVPLELNQNVFEQIAECNAKLTREEVVQLSTLPKGAEVYALQDSTYPAYQLNGENVHAIVLPADPVEQSSVFIHTVFPAFAQQKKYPCESHTLRVMDLSLRDVEAALRDGLISENPCIAVYPGREEQIVRISVRAQDASQAVSACQNATRSVLECLGSYIYGVDVPNIEQALMQRLEKKGLHLNVAESGSNRRAEKRLVKCHKADSIDLNFNQNAASSPAVADVIQEYGSVSQQAANAMAAAVSDGKHIGVGITLPTNREKAASAYVAASFSGHTLSREISIIDFQSVQQLSDACVSHALNLARKFADAHPALPKGAVAATVAMASAVDTAASADKKEGAVSMKSREGGKKPSLLKRFAVGFFPQKDDSRNEKMRKLGIILCLCVFCGSMGYLLNHHQQGVNAAETTAQLNTMKEDFKNGVLDGYDIDEEALSNVAPEVLDEYKPFVAINSDMQGWVEIEGTNLSYPVVQAKDNDYYHRLNFQEEYDYYGVPYLDYECTLDVNPEKTSDNLIIYGHNIGNDGLMFNPLSYYKQLNFYKEHPVVRFDSIYQEQEYKIFGVMIVNAKPEQDNGNLFSYWTQVDFDDESQFNAYVNEVRKRSMWDIDVDVQHGDKLLTLSTCCYDFRPDARCVVVARAIREGEDRTVDTSTAVVNQDAYYPKAYYDALNEKAKYGHVKGIKIEGKSEYSIEVGQTLQLKAITNPADAPINTATWESSAPAVATVDSKTGLVTAVAPGEVNITARADDGGYAANVKVIVKAKNALKYLYFDDDYLSLSKDQEYKLTVYANPEDAAVDLTWSSGSDALSTSVNKSNQKELYIKALAPTSEPVVITVTDKSTGISATCYVTVSGGTNAGNGPLAATANPVTVAAGITTAQIVVSSNDVSILEDLEVYINGDVKAEIDYRNSYINDDGTLVITLIIPQGAVGTSNVSFEYEGNKIGSTTITVQGGGSNNQTPKPPEQGTETKPESITITNEYGQLMNDNSWTFNENGNYGELFLEGVGKNYVWTTTDKNIAFINEDGQLIIQGTGEATITVTGPNGGKASFVVKFDAPSESGGTETPPPADNNETETPSTSEGDETETTPSSEGNETETTPASETTTE